MSSIALVVFLSVIATYVWRACGIAIGEKIDPGGQVFEWISCVAYAMLAGLMARVLIFPVGILENTTLGTRLIPMGIGFVLFMLFKRNFMVGTVVAIVGFLLFVHR